MVKTREEIMDIIKTKFADDTSDETLAFLEDVSDTMTELETKATDTTNWKQKYEDNDKEWREKYKSRFFSSVSQDEDEAELEENETPKIYFDDLFSVKEGK